jgi:hypothetical protein
MWLELTKKSSAGEEQSHYIGAMELCYDLKWCGDSVSQIARHRGLEIGNASPLSYISPDK